MRHFSRIFASLLLSICLPSVPVAAFDSPLSDTAVRQAYFLGQRHDGSLVRLLDKYTKRLPSAKTTPYVSSVTFLTPFAQLALRSDRHLGSYSAQQAQLDHRAEGEFVRIIVEIRLPNSYAAFITVSPRSGPLPAPARLPYDFWKDYEVQIFDNKQALSVPTFSGRADSVCGRSGSCTLIGATLELEVPPDVFSSGTAAILVVPPRGDPVSVDFDLSRFR